jgi:hypothetical protein
MITLSPKPHPIYFYVQYITKINNASGSETVAFVVVEIRALQAINTPP